MLRAFIIAALVCCARAAFGDSGCTSLGGTCQNWEYYICTAGYETGLCSGDSNNRCCLPCDLSCKGTEANYNDAACSDLGGRCFDDSNYCSGSYKSGYCGGPSERKCCVESGSECTLQSYSNMQIRGYNGLDVEVEPGFLDEMDTLKEYARTCDVTVWVTHAFREEGQNLDGTVVPPASNSNHLVGHAIDMNLETPFGWCNGDCMYAGDDSYSECFIQKVMNNGQLRWGGLWIPSDPVHIDDGLNVYDPAAWNDLYYQLQGSC